MGETNLPVVQQGNAAFRCQCGGDIDDVDVRKTFGQINQRKIGHAELRAMTVASPFGYSQRLHRRHRQIVDQDRRRGLLAQLRQRVLGLRDIDLVWVATRHRLPRDEMPGVECSNQDGIVLVFRREGIIVWGGCRDPQIVAALIGLAAQEIGLHVHVAITKQDQINSRLGAANVLNPLRRLDRPIVARALLQFSAVTVEQFGGIAAQRRTELLHDLRQLRIRILVGEKATLAQRIDAAGEDLHVMGHKFRDFGERSRKLPPLREIGHELSEFVVDL